MSKENVKVTYTKTQLKGFKVEELVVLDLYKRAKVGKTVTLKKDIIGEMMACQDKEVEILKAKIKTKMDSAKAFSKGKDRDFNKAIKLAEEAVLLGGDNKAKNLLVSIQNKKVKTEEAAKAKAEQKAVDKESKEKAKDGPVFHRPVRSRNPMTFR